MPKILIVSVFLLTSITSILNFGSIRNDIVRSVQKKIYSSQSSTSYNLEMWDNVIISQNLLDNEDCKYALKYTKKASLYFEKWARIMCGIGPQDSIPNEFLKSNNGIFKLKYDNFRCYADNLFEEKNYDKALIFYSKALNSLNDYSPDSWYIDKAMLNADKARVYSNLDSLDLAVNHFNNAIKLFDKSKDSTNLNKAFLYRYIGEYLKKTESENESIEYFDSAYNMFRTHKDSLSYRNDINQVATKKVQALMAINKDTTAIKFLNKILEDEFILESNTEIFCLFYYYNSVSNFKINEFYKAKELLLKLDTCLLNGKNREEALFRIAILIYKSKLYRQLNNFDLAQISINKAIKILDNNFSKDQNIKFPALVEKANLNYDLGNLIKAKSDLLNALDIVNKDINFDESDLPEVYIKLSKIEIYFNQFNLVEEYFNKSKIIANKYFDMNSYGVVNLLNDYAYVNYSLGRNKISFKLYNKTERLNNSVNKLNSSIIYNGKALLHIKNKSYELADSLFNTSLKLSKEIYPNGSQNTSTVLLNKSESLIQQKKYNEAKVSLNEAKQILDKIFKGKHIDYGKLYMLSGDIYFRTNNKSEALINYKKALSIYKKVYPKTHTVIQYLSNKI